MESKIFSCKTVKEKLMYDNVGGGEKGEQAVLAYRNYMDEYKRFEGDLKKQNKKNKFCSREKM